MENASSNPVGVILVDDDRAILESCSQTLRLSGFEVDIFDSALAALKTLHEDIPRIIVSDIRMPQTNGLEFLDKVVASTSDLPVILLTGHGDIDLAVEAMRRGAWDFLQKPVQPYRLIESVERAVKHRQVILENKKLHEEVRNISQGQESQTQLIGNTPAMIRLKEQVKNLAQVDANVLIYGETGVGKEAVARRLHEDGPRGTKKFVALNCGAVPLNIMESELFGHEKGAFTGAQNRRIGRLEHANGGTLFLDEIESMPMDLQIKFLRVLQDRIVEPIGGNRSVPLDIRVVAAAKTDLFELSRKGKFRDDLYFRLHVAELNIPPLRERKEDIPLLFRYFIEKAVQSVGTQAPTISPLKDQDLMNHNWPGNVRELISEAERHVLGLSSSRLARVSLLPGTESSSLKEQLESYERAVIIQRLSENNGSMQITADQLGIPYKTLYLRVKKYEIDKKMTYQAS
jgi:two-component system, NtrC family, C4-dicarboxylate transport response regulator DctD